MLFPSLARLAGTVLIATGLAACVDITMEIQVLDEQNARGTTTISMDREFYDMSQQQGGGDFCDDDGTFTLTDEAATCVTTEEGAYTDLLEGGEEGEPTPTITNVGPGMVRVTYPTASLAEDFGEDSSDPETMAMMEQFFEGRTLTMTVSGGQIVESNMDIAEDGMSAAIVIPLLGMMTGEVELPDESYAVVKLN
ncbi:MAG TPA: hypothetical protein ENJ90_06175 [Devosia sp.]|nr:hypothetical protein [Devosia sp.]